MARDPKVTESPAPGFEDIYEASPGPGASRARNSIQQSMSPSPVASTSSDKENRTAQSSNDKRKGRVPMGPPRVPSPSGKRKRTATLAGRDAEPDRARRRRTVESDEENEGENDAGFYDPDQDIHERRRIRKGLRDLSKNLADNKNEFMNPDSHGLRDTILEADNFADQVKQTADATIDSRLLASAADFTLQRTVTLVSGDTAQGVDIDEFVSKCKLFMLNSDGAAADDEAAPSNTQRRRRQDGLEEEDNGDPMNWAHLGRFACIQHNSRPSVPGFLLGPLSAEKKGKKITVRRAALKHGNMRQVQPEVLKAGDMENSEDGLSTLCKNILQRLVKTTQDAQQTIENMHTDDLTESEVAALMDKYGVSNTGGLALFRFVINPYSFGQTVENMFYVSFLIRDGHLGISYDERGLPYLDLTEPGTGKSRGAGGRPSKHQAILSLDMANWKEMVSLFNIKEPLIRHRVEKDHENVGASGWYH